jgi:hypothetical protein
MPAVTIAMAVLLTGAARHDTTVGSVQREALLIGSVSELHFIGLNPQAEFIPIDKQSEDNVMHLDRPGKADRLAHQPFDPGA